jgi:hypothetical protein
MAARIGELQAFARAMRLGFRHGIVVVVCVIMVMMVGQGLSPVRSS